MWNVIGASAAGTSHIKNGIPCQDTHQYRQMENGLLLIAIADGAGSAARSQEGAVCAVEVATQTLIDCLADTIPQDGTQWEYLLIDAFSNARKAIIGLAQTEFTVPREFATTLTLVIADHQWLVTGQIGDGVVVAQFPDGDLTVATRPQRGEYANETYFLTMEDALDHVEGCVYPRCIQALAVMTDGLTRLAMNMPDNQPHAPFFRPLLAFPVGKGDEANAFEQLLAFLDSDRVNARTDDDKTLVLAARTSPIPQPTPSPKSEERGGPKIFDAVL